MSELKTDVHWMESVLVFQCCVKVCSLLKCDSVSEQYRTNPGQSFYMKLGVQHL